MEKLVTEQDKESKPVKLNLVDEDELTKVIEQLDLEQQQKEFIKARWLKYVVWWDTRSKNAKGPYHRLRVTAAIAGVVTAALVGVNLGGVELGWPFRLLTLVTSLVVSICLAWEEVYHYGDIWREKRGACERIKVEGFRFFQLIGRYGESEAHRAPPDTAVPKLAWSHKDVYRDFANRVEGIIESEIGSYFKVVAEDSNAGKDKSFDKKVV